VQFGMYVGGLDRHGKKHQREANSKSGANPFSEAGPGGYKTVGDVAGDGKDQDHGGHNSVGGEGASLRVEAGRGKFRDDDLLPIIL